MRFQREASAQTARQSPSVHLHTPLEILNLSSFIRVPTRKPFGLLYYTRPATASPVGTHCRIPGCVIESVIKAASITGTSSLLAVHLQQPGQRCTKAWCARCVHGSASGAEAVALQAHSMLRRTILGTSVPPTHPSTSRRPKPYTQTVQLASLPVAFWQALLTICCSEKS